jgi:RNA-binding protein
MKPSLLSPAERKALKARAHFLDPVVMIGDAGLTSGVLAEIQRNLAAHELIKIRVAGEDREGRDALLSAICEATEAIAVQHIGKLLVVYLAAPPAPEPKPALAERTKRSVAAGARRNPVSGRTMAPRRGEVPPSTRKVPSGTKPPRSARVRKSGQRSAKKPFQSS